MGPYPIKTATDPEIILYARNPISPCSKMMSVSLYWTDSDFVGVDIRLKEWKFNNLLEKSWIDDLNDARCAAICDSRCTTADYLNDARCAAICDSRCTTEPMDEKMMKKYEIFRI